MKRHAFAVGCVVVLACAAAAQEPKLIQPKVVAPQRSEATKRLAEEVESIEAHLQTKKAYVQAAMVAAQAAERAFDRVSKLVGNGVATRETAEDAKFAVEAAKAQVMIREAEANEVLVKLKHAKRQADEAMKADFREKLQQLEGAAAKRLSESEERRKKSKP